MITTELKNNVLNLLVNESPGMSGDFNIKELAAHLGIEYPELEAILDQFAALNILTMQKALGGRVYFTLTAKAHDIIQQGGF